MLNMNKLTKTQKEVLEILKSGLPVPRHVILDGPLRGTGKPNLAQFIHRLNWKLTRHGTRIVCVAFGRRVMYQWVRLLHGRNTGMDGE